MRLTNIAALAAAIALCLVCGEGFAQGTPKPKASLNSEISTSFPDNSVGAITPQILRTVTNDLVASTQQYTCYNPQAGVTYTVQLSDYGCLVTFNNASPVAVTLPQASGSFFPFNVYFTNSGTGTVTITPSVGTINGASNFVLATSLSIWAIADGTNYQVWGGLGSGFVNSGTLGQMAYYAATGPTVSGNPNANISGGTLTLGQAGSVVGLVAFANATSGTVTLQPATGALGSAVATLPAGTYTIVGDTLTQSLTNKTLGNTNTAALKDTLFTLQDDGDATKLLAFQLSGITTGNTRTLTVPNASGTLAVSASAPLTLNATTGALTCATCVTSSGGGAITGTAPVAVSAAAAVSITGAAGQVLAGSGPAFTATPVLGVAGSTVGTQGFQNATSGTITVSPPTGALGSVTNTLQAVSDTFVYKATTDTLTNKSIGGSTNTFTPATNKFTLQDGSDATKQFIYNISGFTTGNTRTWVVPDTNSTFVGTDVTQTFTNKTFDSAGAGNVMKVSGVTVSAGQYPGETSTSNATAGNVGEYSSSSIAIGSAVSLTSTTPANITSITIGAGDWDVWVNPVFGGTTVSVNGIRASISTTSATENTNPGFFISQTLNATNAFATFNRGMGAIGPIRFSNSGSTTVFFIGRCDYSGGTCTGYGIIQARRAR